MVEHTQLFTVAEHGHGDCLRTAFACVLDKSHPTDIPTFVYHEDWTDNDNWFLDLYQWLWKEGYELNIIGMNFVREGHELVPGTLEQLDGYYVAGGRSPRDYPDGKPMYHAVVCKGRDGQLAHDPHHSRLGLAGPPEYAYGLIKHNQPIDDND